jgi:hypothetical protein
MKMPKISCIYVCVCVCVCVYIYIYHCNAFLTMFLVIARYQDTWCVYEFPGMILLRDLKGATSLAPNRDMSVRISTCTSYDLNSLMPVMWKLWR